MIDLGPASEPEVVLAWLRAEIDAGRYGRWYAGSLRGMGLTREALIDNGDANDATQNHSRALLLGTARGYGQNAFLFTGFPTDTAWRRCEVTLDELAEFLYAANVPDLAALSDSRRVADGAKTVADAVRTGAPPTADIARIWAVKETAETGHPFPELITVRETSSPRIVLMDGHTRATAYVIAQRPASIQIFLGTSGHMRGWRFY
jgi:hypothetical protein